FKQASGYWLIPEALLVTLLFALFGTAPAAGGKFMPAAEVAGGTHVAAGPPEFSEWTYPEGADALAVALSISGGGTVVKNEVERKNGRHAVEFTILSGTFEYTIKLDTLARTMLQYERKEKRNPLMNAEYTRFIPMPRAERLAVGAAGGGEAAGIELKRMQSGGFLYKVKVIHGSREYEVKLDALDGQVLEIEK
ncbi:MAG: PepSY domain-containing protein, partial [Planctomycetota bacterium]|nr:PepSY domain-containing protein [Planctomycetota bacterium]